MTEALSLRRKPPSNKSMDQSFSPFVRSLPLSQTLFSKAKLIQKALLSSAIILVSDHDMRMNIYTSLYLASLLPIIADLYHPGTQLFGSSNVLIIMISLI